MVSNRPGSNARKALIALLDVPFDPNRTPYETFSVVEIHGDEARDTAVVIVAAANLELCLRMAIEARFDHLNRIESRELFGPDRPLGSFSAKIAIAYALGIFEKQFRADLHRIRHIRNAFAHMSNHAGFKTEGVVAACNTLVLPTRSISKVFRATDPRNKLLATATQFMICLYSCSKDKTKVIKDSELYGIAQHP